MPRQYFGYGKTKSGAWVDCYVGASLSAATSAVSTAITSGSATTGLVRSSHWPTPKVVNRNIAGGA
jgi:hypothetical protein